MKWIELTGLFAPDSNLSDLGVEVPEEHIEEYPTFVNLSDVSYINPVSEDRLTIRFTDGSKFLYREDYEDIKQKIQSDLTKAILKYKEAFEAANKCTDILLSDSSGASEKAALLMDDLEKTRTKMFRLCEEQMS